MSNQRVLALFRSAVSSKSSTRLSWAFHSILKCSLSHICLKISLNSLVTCFKQNQWLSELQHKLQDFLSKTIGAQSKKCKLVDLFTSPTIFENDSSNSQVNQLKQQLRESEKRTMEFMKKFNKVQSDYHSLIGKRKP